MPNCSKHGCIEMVEPITIEMETGVKIIIRMMQVKKNFLKIVNFYIMFSSKFELRNRNEMVDSS